MKKVVWILGSVLLIGAIGFKVYQKTQQQSQLRSEAGTGKQHTGFNMPTVKTIRIQPQLIQETLRLTGEIQADQTIAVQPRISGRLISLLAKEGMPVKANQLLAVLDDETIRLQIQQSEATQAGIKANLRQAELNASRMQTEKARYQELLNQKYISRQDFDNVESSYLTAQSSVEVLKAQLASAEKNGQLLRVQSNQTRVYSPIAGYVITVPATLGMNLTSGSTLLTVAALNPIKLVFNVDQRDTAKIGKGVLVKFSCDLYPGQEFQGVIREVAPSYDAKTRTLSLAAIIQNPDQKLLPGLFGNAAILVGKKDAALVVPAEAVVNREGQTGVFVVSPQKQARFQPVTTGLQSDGQLEITTGLQAGDAVVVLGQNRLRDGQTVEQMKDGRGQRRHRKGDQQHGNGSRLRAGGQL